MTITIKVDLTIRSDKTPDFIEMIHNDRKTALESEDNIVLAFDIINHDDTPDEFTLYQTCTSKEDLLLHMKNTHYTWKPFMATGAVLSHKHTYI
jgi:quinol monooxygenase YgiN